MNDDDPPFVGDWEKKEILGKGSYGQVNLWKNKLTNKQVAIKKCIIIQNSLTNNDFIKMKDRWEKELEYMLRASCKYVVQSVAVEPKSFIETLNRTNRLGWPLLVMEYCEGGDLRALLNQMKNSNGLKETEIRNILQTLRHAIEYLHSLKITHRDLKPENIVIKKKDGMNFYKLADLGYAKEMIQTSANSFVGTSGYLAPEIIDSPKYSPRVDYWSAGIIAFEIICGIRPFVPHKSLAEWMIVLRNKSSSVMAITENNRGVYKYHQNLFHENQISSCFQSEMEQWLHLTLNRDAKQRGSEFLKNIDAPDELQCPPINTLKFYTKLDEIITLKILTVFCLSSYKFFSYSLNKLKNMNDLMFCIEKDTGIPQKEIYIILPLEQNKVDEITSETNQNDLYLENNINSTMFYVTRYNNPLYPKLIPSPVISEMIKDAGEDDTILKLFYLKELGRKILFVLRNEQRHYSEFLKGLRTYAINLNHAIITFNSKIKEMNNKTMMICANIKLHLNLISNSKEKLDEKNMTNSCHEIIENWDRYCEKMQDDFKLCEINAKEQKRYESILRRSKEAYKSNILEIHDYFNVQQLEDYVEKYRTTKSLSDSQNSKIKEHLTDCLHKCLIKRREFLNSRKIETLQKNIMAVHVEFVQLIDIIKKFIVQLDKYELRIRNSAFKHQDELLNIVEDYTARTTQTEILISKQLNKSQIQNNEVKYLNNPIHLLENDAKQDFGLKLDSLSSQMNVSCFGESDDTRELIDDSFQINLAIHHLMRDCNKFD